MRNFNCTTAEVTISRQAACLFTFYGGNIFLPTADDQTFYVVISKVQNEQDVGLRIISLRRPFGLLV